MKALITGASSGIGRDMARILSRRGCELILVARRTQRLEELKKELKTPVQIISLDISIKENCLQLYRQVQKEDIDILINNAGFGNFGVFDKSSLDTELEMIGTNIQAVHILTKLFLKDFIKKDAGYILNVSSSAAFLPGPLMACYYASKAYVQRLSEAIYEELRRKRSKVYIGTLCPGPVATEFDQKANVRFSVKNLTSQEVAEYAIKKMFQKKLIIVPGALMKAARFSERLLPEKLLLRCSCHMQKRKEGEIIL